MNTKAHIHEVVLMRKYGNYSYNRNVNSRNNGSWFVHYGDSKAFVSPFWVMAPHPRRVKRATKKAIRRHDIGTQKAKKNTEVMLKAKEYAKKLTPGDEK